MIPTQEFTQCFHSQLQATFLKEAINNLSVESANQGQISAGELRKRHANLQERIQGLWNTATFFNKGIDHFEGKLFYLPAFKMLAIFKHTKVVHRTRAMRAKICTYI